MTALLERKKSPTIITVSAVLALIGGLLIITSGYRSHGFLITILGLADQKFGSQLPGTLQWFTSLSITVLGAVIALGGILVVLGGVIIALKHIWMGRLLIGLGGGVGFLGIAIALGVAVFTSGFGTILTHLDYWLGVVVASVASQLAKRA
jgi:hypothetical protein